MRSFRKFKNDEGGAITVDWVVLTAAILGVLLGALTTFNQGVTTHAELASTTIEGNDIPTY
ncbi:hypothetical protein AIOL_004506 [Candidatus Rhodobacter oscarellae]|uniref:Flp pilus assembly protein, pilin Flp n=2 Tax=Candidatus Rhodobacter oscarellae TaxID=1675527 RepID=A0A0J9ECS0_9RHOB|nr:hypothetical protein AIOL_004506 [Candidatus Rhodobacter lobularis]